MLLNVLLASVVVGIMVHEFLHFITHKEAVSICLEESEGGLGISVCCLSPEQQSIELLDSLLTGGVMLAWVMLNLPFIVKPPPEEKKKTAT